MNEKNKHKLIMSLCIVTIIVVLGSLAYFLYNYFYESMNTNSEQDVIVENIMEEEITVRVEDNLVEHEQNKVAENIVDNELDKEEESEIKKKEEQKKQEEIKKNETTAKKNTSNYPYYLKVNYTANTVTAYKKDNDGNYTVPVRAMVCSTGSATPTSGVYKTLNKYRWRLLIGNSYGQYSTRITGQILFHSVPYERKSEDTLITKYYDRLGITTSLGCIRLTVADAKWIYDNCPLGTSVEFYASSNPGPLGKPSSLKITNYGYPLNRWDPTDPNANNPWKNNVNKNEENSSDNNITENKMPSNTTNQTENKVPSNTTNQTENKVPSNTTNETENKVPSNTTNETGNKVPSNTTNETGNKVPSNTTNETGNKVPSNTTNETGNKVPSNTTNETGNKVPSNTTNETGNKVPSNTTNQTGNKVSSNTIN